MTDTAALMHRASVGAGALAPQVKRELIELLLMRASATGPPDASTCEVGHRRGSRASTRSRRRSGSMTFASRGSANSWPLGGSVDAMSTPPRRLPSDLGAPPGQRGGRRQGYFFAAGGWRVSRDC
jgi:hypothetical protein